MAVLSTTELAELRQRTVAGGVADATKPQINAALQAIEDRFEAVRASFGTVIEAAAPGVFTTAAKKILVGHFLLQKFRREGV